MAKLWIISVGLFLFCIEAVAGNCDAILKHGLRNIQISKGSESSIATKFFNHCHKDFENMDNKVIGSVEVEVFGYGGGEGSINIQERKERLTNWCKTNRELAEKNSASYQETQTIYGDAVSAWENCNALNSNDLSITPYISPDARDVEVTLKYSGPSKSGIKFYGTKQKGFTCNTILPNGQKLTIDPDSPPEIKNEAISINCSRDAEITKTINGQTYTVLERGIITVQTASHPLQLYFPKEFTPTLPEQKARELAIKVSDLTKQVEGLSEGLRHGVIAFESEKCPEGWVEYQKGYGRFIRGIDRSGEKRDPEGERAVGSVQEDEFKQHTHKYHVFAFGHRFNNNGKPNKSEDDDGKEYKGETEAVGGKETRPKNVALLYCKKS